MISKELYVCVRFSKDASAKITGHDMKTLKNKMGKFVKILEKTLKPYDKKVKIWIDVFGGD